VPAALVAIACVLVPTLHPLANFSWFVGVGVAALAYRWLARGAVQKAARPATASP